MLTPDNAALPLGPQIRFTVLARGCYGEDQRARLPALICDQLLKEPEVAGRFDRI